MVWTGNGYNLALCEIARGNLEEAERYLQWMKANPMCVKCSRNACLEAFELQGYLCEIRGERKQVLKKMG